MRTLNKGIQISGPARDKLGAELARRYRTGESIRALAVSIGRSYGFVHRLLGEHGVGLRTRGGNTRRQP